jgi:hypothetical protein
VQADLSGSPRFAKQACFRLTLAIFIGNFSPLNNDSLFLKSIHGSCEFTGRPDKQKTDE